jgi:Signal transduction histidine kinase
MKLSYKQKLFGSFFILFALFSICVIFLERNREKRFRTEIMEAKLDGYTEIIQAYLNHTDITSGESIDLKYLQDILPQDIRITLINEDGKVLYDNDITDTENLDNHLDRPEIKASLYQSFGTNIRTSGSNNREYLYYARHITPHFIRVALPYNIHTKSLLKPDNYFLYLVSGLFLVFLILLNYVSGRFGQSITRLNDLTTRIKEDKPVPEEVHFPDDELGEIGSKLVDILGQKELSKQQTEIEREKLIRHIQYSGEGLGIFDSGYREVYTNTHFIRYINLILNKSIFDPALIFNEEEFSPLSDFLENNRQNKDFFTFQLNTNGKIFQIQLIVFEDAGFEISIKDISGAEQNRLLKQEMTENIAHELKTPVTGLLAYLETLNDRELPAEKRQRFIERAYRQCIRLSHLIEDVGLITKIESAGRFSKEPVCLSRLIDDIRIDLMDRLVKNDIRWFVSVKEDLIISGNYSLLYAVFRNLVDNTINYAGNGVEIHIDNYKEDSTYVYFSWYDTGKGVEEKHLRRLFERFYRVDKGRTRETGGSGLGLAIVKNAVLFHGGEIEVKNRISGGLEFLFTLKK